MRKRAATGSARATIDHDEIREWVEQRGGTPATVKRTRRGGAAGILRIDYPGYSGEESLEPISWDEFFERFEESNLAFLMQDSTASGRTSRFSKLVSRDSIETSSDETTEAPEQEPRRSTKKRGARKAPAKKSTSRAAKAKTRSTGEVRAQTKKIAKRGATRRGATPRGARTASAQGATAKKTSKRMPRLGAGPRVGRGTPRKKAAGSVGKKRAATKRRGGPTQR